MIDMLPFLAALVFFAAPFQTTAGDGPGSAIEVDTGELLSRWAEAMQVRPDVEIRFRR